MIAVANNGRVGPSLSMQQGMCLTCSCSNFGSGCWGVSSLSSLLCYDAECLYCKCHDLDTDKEKCCTFHASETFLTSTCTHCRCYQQVCCFECFCTLCADSLELAAHKPSQKVMNEKTMYAKKGYIRSGFCCCISLLDNRYPECCGCQRYSQLCCCVDESLSCKPLWYSAHTNLKRKPDQCCLLGQHRCACLREPTSCMKCADTWFGCGSRCACPVDNDVPCVCSALPYCTMCAKGRCYLSCCPRLQDLPGYIMPWNESMGADMDGHQHQLVFDQHPPLVGYADGNNNNSSPDGPEPVAVYAGTAVYAEAIPTLATPNTGYEQKMEAMRR